MNKFLYAALAATWIIHLVYLVALTGMARRLRREADELGKG
jgi:hypothetical protein